jgi:hypothetical protein
MKNRDVESPEHYSYFSDPYRSITEDERERLRKQGVVLIDSRFVEEVESGDCCGVTAY